MKASSVLFLPLAILAVAASQDEPLFKRAVTYVTVISTTSIPVAQYLANETPASVAASTPASVAASTPTSAATTKSSGSKGFMGWLSSLFGSDDSAAAATTAAAVSSTAAVTTPVETLAQPVTSAATSIYPYSSSSSTTATVHWWDNLGGLASSSAAPASYGSASAVSSASAGSYASSTASSGSSSSGDYGDYDGIVEYPTKAKGVTYSPYTASGSCKSADEVASDFKKLAPFSLIRLYSTDCSGVENSLAAISSSQKLFLGIYNIDTNTITSGLQAIKTAVEASSRGWGAVDTISIGNEQVNDGKATVSDILSALSTARSWLKSNAALFKGSVVTVDTLVAVKNNPGLCSLSDYLAVNCHPYWDGGVQPSNAGPWLMEQISALESACGNNGKEIFITETGWPNKGNNYGNCVPSVANEEAAFKSISGSTTNYLAFTMYNDPWKNPGTYGVESNWGIFGESPE